MTHALDGEDGELRLQDGATRKMANKPGVFWLRPRNPELVDPWKLFQQAAEHQGRVPGELYDEVAVSDEELRQPLRP